MSAAKQPHAKPPVLSQGAPLSAAQTAVILLHGRGSSAQDILTLTGHLDSSGTAYLAPQAQDNTWYPYSFLTPLDDNEPYLSAALIAVGQLVDAVTAAGIPPARTMLLGFSQGACLALEYAARHAQRYGGVAGLSGGLIGPPGTTWDFPGNLDGTPVFLGCSDVDPHIPKDRVQESSAALTRLGASVTERLYPGLGHTINSDELAVVQGMLDALAP